MSLLVVEPLRWALALEPRWIALEQVPPVLPLWEAMAVVLRSRGYSVATSILTAEAFGVPQTRKRAFLIASLDGPVSMPRPTHQRYVAPRRRQESADTLFAVPEPERIVLAEDRGLLPWVSMAQALNLTEGASPSPSPSVTAGGTGSGGGVEVFAGREARERVAGAVVQRSNYSDGSSGSGTAAERGRTERPVEAPSVAITSKGFQWVMQANAQSNAAVRDVDEPAPTITGGHDTANRRWVLRAGANANDIARPADEPAPTLRFGQRCNDVSWVLRSGQTVAGEGRAERPADEPGLTVTSRFDLCKWKSRPTHFDRRQGDTRSGEYVPAPTIGATNPGAWVTERPATTVNGDPRIAEPGRHDPEQSGSQYGEATVRVSVEEAAALQTFPPGYPWQGSLSAQYLQIGNACPCLLAWHVLDAATAPCLAVRESEAA